MQSWKRQNGPSYVPEILHQTTYLHLLRALQWYSADVAGGVQAKTESKIEQSANKVTSEVQSEIQRLRRQLQEKDVELEEVSADLKRLAADGVASRVRYLACSWVPS